MSDGEKAAQARLVLSAERDEIARLAAWVEDAADALRLPRALVFPLQLCLEEAVANVIEHGTRRGGERRIAVTLRRRGGRVAAAIEDDGAAFDPTRAVALPPGAALAGQGGLGLALIRKFAASIAYERVGGRNRLTLGFAPPAAPRDGPPS